MMGTVGTILNVVHDLWVKIVPACTIFGHGCIMDFPEDFMHVFEVVGNLVDFVVNVSDVADHLFATRPGALLTHGYLVVPLLGNKATHRFLEDPLRGNDRSRWFSVSYTHLTLPTSDLV